jgi:hypothetical protein
MSKTKQVYSEFGRTVGMVPFLEQDVAMKTCRDWTNTKCQNASEIIPMLEKYAKLRTMDKTFGLEIPEKDKEGYESIEKYRKEGIKFWKEAMSQPYKIPSMGEMTLTSTFHWSIYNMNKTITNNNDKGFEELYDNILTRIELKDGRDEIHNMDYIKKYKKTIEPEIERIKEKAFKQANSQSSWVKWYEFW